MVADGEEAVGALRGGAGVLQRAAVERQVGRGAGRGALADGGDRVDVRELGDVQSAAVLDYRAAGILVRRTQDRGRTWAGHQVVADDEHRARARIAIQEGTTGRKDEVAGAVEVEVTDSLAGRRLDRTREGQGRAGEGAHRGATAAGGQRQGARQGVVAGQRSDQAVGGDGRAVGALAGRGEVGAGGGPAGDLYVEIVEAEHPYLIRDGHNLHVAIEVSFAAASLGTKVKVECLDGEIDVEVRAGTQSGATIPVRGKGMTRLRAGTRGDLIVHVEVQTPHKLNREQEELLRKFAASRGEKPGDVKIKGHEQGFFSKFRDAFGR